MSILESRSEPELPGLNGRYWEVRTALARDLRFYYTNGFSMEDPERYRPDPVALAADISHIDNWAQLFPDIAFDPEVRLRIDAYLEARQQELATGSYEYLMKKGLSGGEAADRIEDE